MSISKCSFCHKEESVIHLIIGPQVTICNECIELCSDILQENKKSFPILNTIPIEEVAVIFFIMTDDYGFQTIENIFRRIDESIWLVAGSSNEYTTKQIMHYINQTHLYYCRFYDINGDEVLLENYSIT